MSKSSTAKQKADKTGKSAAGIAPTPVATTDIVAGKLNDQEWNTMLDCDDGDEFVLDLVEEVCAASMNIIYSNYLQEQLIPYTVLQAKDAMLEMIEWQFLAFDEGEENVEADPNWTEDKEPQSATTDCWAQGAVPKDILHSASRMEAVSEDLEDIEDQTDEHFGRSESSEHDSGEVDPKDKSASDGEVNNDETANQDFPEEQRPSPFQENDDTAKASTHELDTKETKARSDVDQRYNVPAERSPQTRATISNSSSKAKTSRAERAPGTTNVAHDQTGNVIAMVKLNPDRLPSHRIRTGYQVVDAKVEAEQARLDAIRKGRRLRVLKPAPPSEKPTKDTKQTVEIFPTLVGRTHEPLPPVIDSMELAPGVVVREGDRIKRGPKPFPSATGSLHKKLRPVLVQGGSHNLSVHDLIGNKQPVVRRMDSPPIPPILPHPPAQKAS